MALYTFFLDYRGGTYISQVTAPDHLSAPRVWAEAFQLDQNDELAQSFEPSFRRKLSESLESDEPTSVLGLTNTWCLTVVHLDELAIIHFTRTEKDNIPD